MGEVRRGRRFSAGTHYDLLGEVRFFSITKYTNNSSMFLLVSIICCIDIILFQLNFAIQ
jgi:hypothetical protein